MRTQEIKKTKQIQLLAVGLGFALMLVKFTAYFLTGSKAILSDALESIINVVAGFFAWYSILIASKPKDHNHPYGHGKIEFVSAGFEGGLIVIAACFIIYEGIHSFFFPKTLAALEWGIGLTIGSGGVNFLLGSWLIKLGKQYHSEAMVADGKHLLTDTYTSVGLLVGLIILFFTQLTWVDSALAILMGFVILLTGYKLVKQALSNLLDETDERILAKIIDALKTERKPTWIDVHNLRIVKHGGAYHIDAHVTLPWYWSLEQAHDELTEIDRLVASKFPNETEFFIHPDPCIPSSCEICQLQTCGQRKKPFVKLIPWDTQELLSNQKHLAN